MRDSSGAKEVKGPLVRCETAPLGRRWICGEELRPMVRSVTDRSPSGA